MRVILELDTRAVCSDQERRIVEQFLVGQVSGLQATLLLEKTADDWRDRLAALVEACVAKEGGRVVIEGEDGVRFADLRIYRSEAKGRR